MHWKSSTAHLVADTAVRAAASSNRGSSLVMLEGVGRGGAVRGGAGRGERGGAGWVVVGYAQGMGAGGGS